MRKPFVHRCFLSFGIALIVGVTSARASPWVQVGQAQLRSDIEVLAAAGVIDNITTQWPLPWGGILYRLDQPGALRGQPAYVVAAAERVRKQGMAATQTHELRTSFTVDATNAPAVVRGFDAMGLQDLQSQANVEYQWDSTVVHLAVGAQTTNRSYLWNSNAVNAVPGSLRTGHRDNQILLLDGSYIAQRVGNAAVYAGYLTHWWGPGWISALSLSNNARPFPQIGISRIDTTPFRSPWLSWIGPWQAEFFIGVLDGPRIARNTLFNGLRVAFNPLPGLEFALARTEELCGTGHPCKPVAEFFNVYNDNKHPSKSKDETNFDIRYTGRLRDLSYSVYLQVMDRDTGPFVHSFSNHLFGASVWVPVRSTSIRLTAEYADTISTLNFLSFGKDVYGITYTDYKYIEGWQYRDRTLGSSLDSDSRLASLQASWIGPHDITYTLTYHHAAIGSPQSPGTNIVTTTPVTINIGEARVRMPFSWGAVDVTGRFQDDQPRPDKGFQAAIESALTINL